MNKENEKDSKPDFSDEVKDWFDSGPIKPEILDMWLKIIAENRNR